MDPRWSWPAIFWLNCSPWIDHGRHVLSDLRLPRNVRRRVRWKNTSSRCRFWARESRCGESLTTAIWSKTRHRRKWISRSSNLNVHFTAHCGKKHEDQRSLQHQTHGQRTDGRIHAYISAHSMCLAAKPADGCPFESWSGPVQQSEQLNQAVLEHQSKESMPPYRGFRCHIPQEVVLNQKLYIV